MKNKILLLGSVALAVTPLSLVISCGNDSKKDSKKTLQQMKNQLIKFSKTKIKLY